jgi:hypothetical protein
VTRVPAPAGLRKYLRKAFLLPWNLLAFFGGLAAAALSPWPDALLPMVLAGELAFLGGLVSIGRFRSAVDAEEHTRGRREGSGGRLPAATLSELLAGLPNDARVRFHRLRLRCLEMQKLAAGARGKSPLAADAGDDLRRGSLDRLLWIFLRLLVSQDALRRFLRSTTEAELGDRAADLERQLAAAKEANDERLVTSLTDSVALANLRLENYRKADQNAQFVLVELDRIESKIQTLTEMMVNRQDPDLLASQVDQAAASMNATETAIDELRQLTGITDQLVEPPPILDAEFGKVAQ